MIFGWDDRHDRADIEIRTVDRDILGSAFNNRNDFVLLVFCDREPLIADCGEDEHKNWGKLNTMDDVFLYSFSSTFQNSNNVLF